MPGVLHPLDGWTDGDVLIVEVLIVEVLIAAGRSAGLDGAFQVDACAPAL